MKLMMLQYAILFQITSCTYFGLTNRLGRQKIQVILLPHSHDDVGWLDTVDAIYQHGPGVKQIITSYIDALLENSERKFVQVETVYFERWWNEQNQQKQEKVKQLVKSGQLGFAAGGLVMNDEATPYYEDIIDQITFGHEFLFNTFGITPRVGWQIDPFGHSNAQSVLSYLFGMEAQYFARIDYQDKQNRLQHKEMEMVVVPYTKSQQQYPIFTHVNFEHYSSPRGFDFDPLRPSGGRVTDQNQEEKANLLNSYFMRQAKSYKGNLITHTLGDDNEWSSAKSYYENMEKVMHFINANPEKYNITIKFGTPSDYINALNEYADETFYPIKNDDFFPYADKEHCYWTGYFTSKVAFKGFVRYTGRQFQQIKSFVSYSLALNNQDMLKLKDELLLSIKELGYSMGISQHHDAVTGTSKDFVTKDYVKMLYKDQVKMNDNLHKLINVWIKKDLKEDQNDQLYQYTYNATATQCKEVYDNLVNNKTVLIVLLDSKINEGSQDIIKVKVPKLSLDVIDIQNQLIEGDILCSNMKDDQDCTLYFNYNIRNGLQYYKIRQGQEKNSSAKIILQATYTNITVNSKISLGNGPSFYLFYKYYIASTNNIQPSGAYIFRPDGNSQVYGQISTVRMFNGSVVTELNIKRDNVDTWIRKYQIQENQYEIETFIDSISKEQNKGKEIVVIFKQEEIHNGKTFYTDANGMDLQERKLGYRETWTLQSNEYVAENYYPVNGIISITDEKTNYTMAVVNDRSQGGSSFREGEIELMIHRRTYTDDRRGVGESLNEEEDNPSCIDIKQQNCTRKIGLRQNIIQHLVFYDQKTSPNAARKAQLFHDFQPIKIFGVNSQRMFNDDLDIKDDLSLLHQIRLTNQQEEVIAKLYVIPKKNMDEFLIRIQNMQEEGNIKIYFPGTISSEETILSGLKTLSEQQHIRLKWNPNHSSENSTFIPSDEVGPQQIKTFAIKI